MKFVNQHAKYRIVEVTDAYTFQKYFIVQYWELWSWKTYRWLKKRRFPEADEYGCECPTVDDAMKCLEQCKSIRTPNVVYSE